MKTLIILSGGLDSTVLAYHMHANPNDQLVGCVSINYGQRHHAELKCAERTTDKLGVQHWNLNLSNLQAALGASALTSQEPIPEGHYAEESMKATVVPNRNMILIALATGVGITVGAEQVAYGAHAGDHAIYPDCRPEFARAMDDAIALCDYHPPRLIRPFIHRTKSDIVTLGVKLGVPFEDTWSCYKGEALACGRCGTCVERLEAFAQADVEDPLVYSDRDFWRTVVKTAPRGNLFL